MMAKKTKTTIFLLIILIIIISGVIFKIKLKENSFLKNIEGKIIYFYGKTCPHCANVEKFFEENKVKEKIQFEEKEVYSNKGNAKLLILVAKKKCGLGEDKIGVPFLWDGSKCIIGDQPIIDYFQEKLRFDYE